jgi:hypothetical protein
MTNSTPEQFVAALTDFGPGRSKLFGNSADDYLKVHDQGPRQADVTEGSRGVWERLHYDWSDPVRAENPIRGCEQQSCGVGSPAVMIPYHVRSVLRGNSV